MKRKLYQRPLHLLALGLIACLIMGCGDSNIDEISGQPASSSPAEGGAGPGAPTKATASGSLTLSGTSNADKAPLVAVESSVVQAGFRPTQPPQFFAVLQNKSSADASRLVQINIFPSPSKLEVGSRISANSKKSAPYATVNYVEQVKPGTGSSKVFESYGGELVVTRLTNDTITLRFDSVALEPRSTGALGAAGNPVLRGELSFAF